MTTAADFLPSIADEPWRRDAACSFSADLRLWDADLYGESREDRAWRHEHAKAICRTCPVLEQCRAAIDWTRDDGIRAGELIPVRKHATRPGRLRDIRHGTESGATAHKRRGEKPCDRCRIAAIEAHQRRAKARAS